MLHGISSILALYLELILTIVAINSLSLFLKASSETHFKLGDGYRPSLDLGLPGLQVNYSNIHSKNNGNSHSNSHNNSYIYKNHRSNSNSYSSSHSHNTNDTTEIVIVTPTCTVEVTVQYSKRVLLLVPVPLTERTDAIFLSFNLLFDFYFPLIVNYQNSIANASQVPSNFRQFYMDWEPISRLTLPQFVDVSYSHSVLWGGGGV